MYGRSRVWPLQQFEILPTSRSSEMKGHRTFCVCLSVGREAPTVSFVSKLSSTTALRQTKPKPSATKRARALRTQNRPTFLRSLGDKLSASVGMRATASHRTSTTAALVAPGLRLGSSRRVEGVPGVLFPDFVAHTYDGLHELFKCRDCCVLRNAWQQSVHASGNMIGVPSARGENVMYLTNKECQGTRRSPASSTTPTACRPHHLFCSTAACE